MSSATLPAETRRNVLATLGDAKRTLTARQVVFCAYRAGGMSATRAYLKISPKVTLKSASVMGSKWARLFAQHIRTLRSNQDLRLSALVDAEQERLIGNPQALMSDRLKAMHEIDAKLGRFAPDTSITLIQALDNRRDAEVPEVADLTARFLPEPESE